MNPSEATGAASLTSSALVALGIGPHAAGIVGTIVGIYVLGTWALGNFVMPKLSVADATSPAWYRNVYGVLARLTGNTGKNAPMPPSLQPAGGIVPTPPSLKQAEPPHA